MITPALLRILGASMGNSEIYAPLLETARVVPGDDFNTITSRNGIAMLVSQLAHESGYFSTLAETLNYSVQALMSGNRARYFTPEQAKHFGYIRDAFGTVVQNSNPRMIAKMYYGGRLGNRGTHTEDGWTFRGGGLIQLTGRHNFTAFGKAVDMEPEEAATYCRSPEGAVASALWYWRSRPLLVPASRGDVVQCTKIIQGADGGLESRTALFQMAYKALGYGNG